MMRLRQEFVFSSAGDTLRGEKNFVLFITHAAGIICHYTQIERFSIRLLRYKFISTAYNAKPNVCTRADTDMMTLISK